ncbi:MAG: AbrB/MazE/SpoVT family DNA-binding domain-containing protein [Desulfuromonadales bacterium]
METTLSSKGQIVIPRHIRENHGWKPGVRFSISEEGDVIVLKPAVSGKTTQLEDVIGCAGYDGPKKSLADMKSGIFEEARRQSASWSLC